MRGSGQRVLIMCGLVGMLQMWKRPYFQGNCRKISLRAMERGNCEIRKNITTSEKENDRVSFLIRVQRQTATLGGVFKAIVGLFRSSVPRPAGLAQQGWLFPLLSAFRKKAVKAFATLSSLSRNFFLKVSSFSKENHYFFWRIHFSLLTFKKLITPLILSILKLLQLFFKKLRRVSH